MSNHVTDSNAGAKTAIAAIPYIGGLLNLVIPNGETSGNETYYKAGHGLDSGAYHLEPIPAGLVQGRDYGLNLNSWFYSWDMQEKWKQARTILGEAVAKLSPAWVAQFKTPEEVQGALLSTDPADYKPVFNPSRMPVYAI